MTNQEALDLIRHIHAGGVLLSTEADAVIVKALETRALLESSAMRVAELEFVLGWVETWVSNPASTYSTDALNGLFGMTLDKISALRESM